MGFVIIIIDVAYYALVVLILARIILSFVNINWYELTNLVYRLTEPLLAPVRNILPPMGGLDFSPMIVLIAASVLRRLLYMILF